MKPKRIAPLSFRISPQLKKALEMEAEKDSRSVSSLIVKIITEWFKRKSL